MIFDLISNASRYTGLSDNLDYVLRHLHSIVEENPDVGKYTLRDDQLYYQVSEYKVKKAEDCLLETHHVYTDLQVIIKGSEKIGYCPSQSLIEVKPYDVNNDIAFYKGFPSFFNLKPGLFAVFFAGEPHMPCVDDGLSGNVKKIVIKLKW